MEIKAIRPEPSPVEKYVLEMSPHDAANLAWELAQVFSACSVPPFPTVRRFQGVLNGRDQ